MSLVPNQGAPCLPPPAPGVCDVFPHGEQSARAAIVYQTGAAGREAAPCLSRPADVSQDCNFER